MSKIEKGLYYTKEHEWVRIEGDTATVGVTDHAQEALGDITYIDLPEPGDKVNQFDALLAVESTKAASDVFAPVGGEVAEVNEALDDRPELVNQDPYGKGWMVKLKGVDASQTDQLMDSDAYAAFEQGDNA